MIPMTDRALSAVRKEGRLILSISASSRSGGRRLPALNSPLSRSSLIRWTTSSVIPALSIGAIGALRWFMLRLDIHSSCVGWRQSVLWIFEVFHKPLLTIGLAGVIIIRLLKNGRSSALSGAKLD